METAKKHGRPKTNLKKIEKTSEIGTKEGEIRATFIISKEQLHMMKAFAYWERITIKQVLQDALSSYFKEHARIILKILAEEKKNEKI